MKLHYQEEDWNYKLVIYPMMAFVVIFFIWATFAEIDEVVKGEGRIVPSGQTKVLQHFEGGIITDILVSEGKSVKKGDVLYTLKNDYFMADLKSQELEIMALQAKAMRLEALIDNKSLVFAKEFTQTISGILESERQTFEEENANHKRQLGIAKDQLKQKVLRLDELSMKLQNLEMEMQLANENMQIQDALLKKNVVSRKNYLAELSKKQTLVTEMQNVRSLIPIVKEEISESEKKVESVNSEMLSKNLKQLSEVKLSIRQIQEKYKASLDRDLRKDIVSPVNGVVNKLYFNTVDGIIKPGDNIAEITPVEDKLIIEARIKPSDRAQVWSNQKVSIEITAYDFSKYGLLEGRVVSISPDSTEDRQGNRYYALKVKADTLGFDENSRILPGMVANINILTGKKTVLRYLIKPLKDIAQNSFKEI
ncbi:HlyD family type I secretion periplasmic adaptor subunit [Sulfurimonas sp.]|jgi:HlyD family secretion protein/adhesin transport system membrane fusion protein|uniref:HlyD family type I secretion periplasmic adaptor subunit n=1 Tax=Sulfurimonas sp. TaxID=2022749 RepID=UPI0025EC111D|nr:HlyD family type I secretion periplasmic adaptor subunit [Sulfurimonas sp.]MCK9472612.1 HlyD family type I secretion periplasmic adaptor subunit [Sulfurimonas sp.]